MVKRVFADEHSGTKGAYFTKRQTYRRRKRMHNNYTSEHIESLIKAVLTLRSEDECRAFFNDLCTIKELQDMAQRLEVARMLREGKNYNEISTEIKTSTATISRVKNCLDYGTGGYRTVLERTDKKEK